MSWIVVVPRISEEPERIPTDVKDAANAVAQAKMRKQGEAGYQWEDAEVIWEE